MGARAHHTDGSSCPCAPRLARLRAADLYHAVGALAPAQRDELFGILGLRVKGARLRQGAGRLVVAKMRQLSPPQQHAVARVLGSPLALPLLGRMVDTDQQRYVQDLRDEIATMRHDWPARLLALAAVWFWEEAQLPVASLEPLLADLDEGDDSAAAGEGAAGEGDADEGDDAAPVAAGGAAHRGPPPTPPPAPASREGATPGETSPGSLLAQAGRGRFGLSETEAELVRALPDLLTGVPVRAGAWLVRGYLETWWAGVLPGADPPTPEAAFAFQVGHLVALLEQREARGVAALDASGDLLARIVTAEGLECLTAPLLRALVDITPDRAADLLDADPLPFAEWPGLVRPVLHTARDQIERGDPTGAERLLAALDDHLTVLAAQPGAPGADAASRAADQLGVERAGCRRTRHDFAGALAILERVPPARLSGRAGAERAIEEALARAGIADIATLSLPRGPAERERWATRIEHGRDAARRALAITPDHAVAHLLLGLDAITRGEDQATVRHLTSALDGLGPGAPPELAAGLRFHRGLAHLRLLEPGTDDAAAADLQAGIEGGHDPGVEDLIDALDALEAHGSPRASGVLGVLAKEAPGDERVAAALARSAARGNLDAARLAYQVATRRDLPHVVRWSLLDAALAAHATSGAVDEDAVAEVADALEDVATHASRPELDERWAALLRENDVLRTVLDPVHADTLRVHALRRLGRIGEALAAARQLFYRSLERADTDPAEMLELLRDLGAAPELLGELGALVRAEEEPPGGQAAPVLVLFVGGDESHARYREAVDREVTDRHGESVRVAWWFPGWSSAWTETAEAIEARYPEADAVVIMTLVRTLFGRRIRRTAGEAGLPWIACTGHGRGSMERAIAAAARVARAAG